METFKILALCLVLACNNAYVSSYYNQPELYPQQQTYNEPSYYPPAAGVPQLYYPYGGDQTTTTAPPSGLWKIFSIFSLPNLPNFFAQKPEETTTVSNIYHVPPQYGSPYQQPPPSSYNYAAVYPKSPVGKPSYQYFPMGLYPESYPYTNGKSKYSQPLPSSVPSYYAPPSTVATPSGPSPSTKSPYGQPNLPAYSIYLVPQKPANHPQGHVSGYGQHQDKTGQYELGSSNYYYNQPLPYARPTVPEPNATPTATPTSQVYSTTTD